MKIYFNINFKTSYGQKLRLVILENDCETMFYDMMFTNNDNWFAEVDYFAKSITYKYQIVDDNNVVLQEEFAKHHINLAHSYDEFIIPDTWNNKNFPENYLNNKILKNKLSGFKPQKVAVLKKHSHHFRIEAPIYHPNWEIILLGSVEALGNWNYDEAIQLVQTDYGVWEVGVSIPNVQKIEYKYGIRDVETGKIISLEHGDNRWTVSNLENNIILIKNDHYFKFHANELYRGAGVAIPVFALRSKNGFGVGEFNDIKSLADWAKSTNLGIIQILPINDTTANYSWTDSYPYAAISVYALHPQYISIENLEYPIPNHLQNQYDILKTELNSLELIDYEKMIANKWMFLKAIFDANKAIIYKDKAFKKFLKENETWLLPYAAFCVQRDKYNTPNFNNWKTHKKYIAGKVTSFFNSENKDYEATMLHAWVQYQLDAQLNDAVEYAHQLGISLKGDLPIGIYRYSVEAWAEPELFGMNFQAGAPPDQFTDLGQNWEFPTYNWEKMKEDGYQWWKNRFKALEKYFDAMRIDHILGFFRIWRMPLSATQGILGYFYPAIPVTEDEFRARSIPFNFDRYCKPYINDEILNHYFGDDKDSVVNEFMNNHFDGTYTFKEEFDTQRKLKEYFELNSQNTFQEKLISLCANVLFLVEEKDGTTVYHPRFNINKTDSYRFLQEWEQKAVYDLYVDYFFKRQDQMWAANAMEKLPMILNATDMLICGEDLGLVPDCVPVVMDNLAITALKVQRMPSDNILWYDPKNAGYMNVVTASSHDSSTLRQWWHEDRELTQKYFNDQLHQYGTAPWNLEPELAEIIMKQHLYNEAMLAIFPIQEFFATDSDLVNPNLDNERINQPAVFPHYWRYRMHLNVEDLEHHTQFNNKIAHWVETSGRK